jgi:hypothetical protein
LGGIWDGVPSPGPRNLAKVSYDKKKQQIEIENYGIEPVRLSKVRVSGT